MTADEIHEIALKAFNLFPKQRNDGWSYWTEETNDAKSIRVLRVSLRPDGTVAEMKLAVSSNREQKDIFFPAPYTEESLRAAIARELAINC